MNDFLPITDWCNDLEQVAVDCKNKNPTLVEIPDKEITTNKQNPYNILIEGDNYHSLFCLQENYKEKINVIYIDPPYNTGEKKHLKYKNSFINKKNRLPHSRWISMMGNRLTLAKTLLSNDGVIFISIDDYEQANLKLLCNKIFGENNFITMFSVVSNPKGRRNSKFVSLTHDYCLVYAKQKDKSYFIKNIPNKRKDRLFRTRVLVGESSNKPIKSYLSTKHYSVYYNKEKNDLVFKKENNINDIEQYLISKNYIRYISTKNNHFIENTYTQKKLNELFREDNLFFREKSIYEKEHNAFTRIKSILTSDKKNNIDLKSYTASQQLKKMGLSFYNPKNVYFIKLLLSLFNNKSITVLDFFAGSGTTAQAVLQLNKEDGGNRQFILCTNNENKICEEVTYPRIEKVINGYYKNGEVKKEKYVEGLGGNLKYYRTGFNK